MAKNTIVALVIGLIVGAMAIWLVFGFTDAGTLLVRYGNQTEKSKSVQPMIEEDGVAKIDLAAPPGGQEGISQLLEQAEPWNPGMCDPEFDRTKYNVSGDLLPIEFLGTTGFPPQPKYRLTWNTHLDIPLNCIEGGSQLNIKWYDLRGSSNDFPFDPSPRSWQPNQMFHEENINLPNDRQSANIRTSFNGFQQEMPGNKYGVQNVFTLIEPNGNVRELDRFCAKAEPFPPPLPLNPLNSSWRWVESRQCTFY